MGVKIFYCVIFMVLSHVCCMNLTSNAKLDLLKKEYNDSFVNKSVNFKENDLIETSCHVKTEELVAIAKVSVSSALENICNYSKVISSVTGMENHIIKEFEILKNMLLTITNKIFLLEQKVNNNYWKETTN